ncbi:hypothetical protein [Flavobacterium sp. 5]|uniref:hypothetical protein n=1 Tax=Flavobacterium sp. 5 TaxID=2035199 RepID=UPI000CA750AA|nr:hypothetical protein [Flavobacterium sp. 5]PKB18342.1 hypothetical protein CLU82_3615 [Flavobacterium sp. 5]
MINIKNNTYILLFLLFSFCSNGQVKKLTALQIISNASDAYIHSKYMSMNSTYNLYLDYNSEKVYEHYAGIVLKKNEVIYFEIKSTEFITFKNLGIKINYDQKAIVLEKQNKATEESPLSLKNYLNGYNAKLIDSDKNNFICELTPNKISQIMLSKIIIHIKKNDYSIVKQTLYFVEKMETKDAKGKRIYTTPRLEINFSPREKNEKRDNLLTSKDNYFTERGNEIVLSKRFSTYQIFKS